MSKALLAVYDSSKEYVDRFLAYVKKKHNLYLESVGFTDLQTLEKYLSKNKVDLLLFSKEEFVDEKENKEYEYEQIFGNENIKEFVYLGKRRNSKSRIKHINKYQSMEVIISEITNILNIDSYEESNNTDANIVGVYALCSGKKALKMSLILSGQRAVRANLLYINLDRFSLIDNCSISDLIYFYKTNKEKLKETLLKTKVTISGFDILSAPFDMNDIDEIGINEWPDFISELARIGSYDVVVLDMYEAFRNLEEVFNMCREIFVITDDGSEASEKLEKLKEYFLARKREDLINKISIINAEE